MRPIPGFDGYYADAAGAIWSSRGGGLVLKKTSPGRKGYRRISMYAGNRKSKMVSVHHLVLLAFVGPRPHGMIGCHNNGVNTDNRPENLRWDTHAGNVADRNKHGTSPIGERNPASKLTADDVRGIRRMLTDGLGLKDISPHYGVTSSCVARIRDGATWNWLT